MERNNIAWVLICFIRKFKIPVTNKSIEAELEKHPDYPSLLAISDVLNNWRVPNSAYNLRFEDLAEIQKPFIAQLESKFVLVTDLDKKQIVVSNEQWNHHKMGAEEFKRAFTGIILIAEPDEASGEINYLEKRQREMLDEFRTPFILSGLFLILLTTVVLHSSYLSTYNWQIGLLTLFKSAGVTISVLLLIHSIDVNNPLIQRLCSGQGNKNCNQILSSKASKITEWLSWSEIGFFYFTGTWLVLLFNSHSGAILGVLAILNLLSLPYTFFSIYYQWRVSKQWCVLFD